MEEYLDQNLEIMLELATLQEKSRNDEDEKLWMSKALLCKKEFQSLSEDVDPEVYIKHAFKCTGCTSKELKPRGK